MMMTKKTVFVLFILTILTAALAAFSYDFPALGGEDTFLTKLELYTPVELTSNVQTLTPAIKFESRFVLNDYLKLQIAGNFFNDASFANCYDDLSGDNYSIQNWNAIINELDVAIGWKYTGNVFFDFLLGGGVDIDQYYREEDKNSGEITEKILGRGGFVDFGFAVKLNSPVFYDKLYHFFAYQKAYLFVSGNGSIGIEGFVFGKGLPSFSFTKDSSYEKLNPTEIYSWNDNLNSNFKYFQLQTDGKVGISIPLQRLIYAFSMLDNMEFKVELDHKFTFRFYYLYEYYNSSTLRTYNIRSAFQPDIGILFGLSFRPINEIELYVHYRPAFLLVEAEWVDYEQAEYKNYAFSISHEFEISGLCRFPPEEIFRFKLGVKYYIRQNFTYQYFNDGINLKESISSSTFQHYINFITEFQFKLINRQSVELLLKLLWEPRIILFDPSDQKTPIRIGSGSYEFDSDLLNLAIWKLEVETRFNPKKIGK